MSIVVIVTFKAAEGRYNDLKQIIQTILPTTEEREGCELLRSAGDTETGVFTIYEIWEDAESHKAYREWSSQNRDPAPLIALLREPPGSQTLEHIY